MVNIENSLVRTFTLFPKHVTFTPRYGQLVLGNTLNPLKSNMHLAAGCQFTRICELASGCRLPVSCSALKPSQIEFASGYRHPEYEVSFHLPVAD